MTNKELLDRQIEKLLEERAALELLPADDYTDGALLLIEKQFTDTGAVYSYAAVKGGGLWYCTGTAMPRGRQRWSTLMDNLGVANPKCRVSIYYATTVEQVATPYPVEVDPDENTPRPRNRRRRDLGMIMDGVPDGAEEW
jgi:hypothetical protein